MLQLQRFVFLFFFTSYPLTSITWCFWILNCCWGTVFTPSLDRCKRGLVCITFSSKDLFRKHWLKGNCLNPSERRWQTYFKRVNILLLVHFGVTGFIIFFLKEKREFWDTTYNVKCINCPFPLLPFPLYWDSFLRFCHIWHFISGYINLCNG